MLNSAETTGTWSKNYEYDHRDMLVREVHAANDLSRPNLEIGYTLSPVTGRRLQRRVANATSTVALVPGSLSAFWGYRGELKGPKQHLLWLGLPSMLGGLAGAVFVLGMGPGDQAIVAEDLVHCCDFAPPRSGA